MYCFCSFLLFCVCVVDPVGVQVQLFSVDWLSHDELTAVVPALMKASFPNASADLSAC